MDAEQYDLAGQIDLATQGPLDTVTALSDVDISQPPLPASFAALDLPEPMRSQRQDRTRQLAWGLRGANGLAGRAD